MSGNYLDFSNVNEVGLTEAEVAAVAKRMVAVVIEVFFLGVALGAGLASVAWWLL